LAIEIGINGLSLKLNLLLEQTFCLY
jgi:hypothetical protein